MKEFDDVLVDLSYKNLEIHYNRFKDIDTKAIGIMTITGALLTLLPKSVTNDDISIVLYILILISFLVTIILCIGVVMIRKYDLVSTDNLIKELSKEKDDVVKMRRTINTIAASEKKIGEEANNKADILKFAVLTFGFSIILLIIYLMR